MFSASIDSSCFGWGIGRQENMLEKQADLVTARVKKKRIREKPATEADKSLRTMKINFTVLLNGWPYLLSSQYGTT